MISLITKGVKVTVDTVFQPEYSSPDQFHFVFTYKIRIENHSESTIKLMRRKWFIFDSNGTIREVEGEGVVGQQPILEAGEVHEYVSGCNLKTGLGKMNGVYTFKKEINDEPFVVQIPEFNLVVPYKLN